MGITPRLEKMANKLSLFVSDGTQAAVAAYKNNGEYNDKPDAIYLAGVSAMSALHVLAIMIGDSGDDDMASPKRVQKALNPTAMLFAGILASKMGTLASTVKLEEDVVKIGDKETEAVSAGIEIRFGLDVIYDTLVDCEKVLGKQPDEYLDTVMCQAAREEAAKADKPLSAFLETRRNSLH